MSAVYQISNRSSQSPSKRSRPPLSPTKFAVRDEVMKTPERNQYTSTQIGKVISSPADLFTPSPDPLAMFNNTTPLRVKAASTTPRSTKTVNEQYHDINKPSGSLATSSRARQTSLLEQERLLGIPYFNPYHNLDRPSVVLPAGIPDHVNRGKVHPKNHRMLFKEMIQHGSKDEPHAPPIDIVNHVDKEPCPPFEFHWTNKMFYGKGVPRQDRNLKGCECIGKCDPTSQACACVQRQEFYFNQMKLDDFGFMYNESGSLRYHSVPVFECNAACGCPPECTNRVCSV